MLGSSSIQFDLRSPIGSQIAWQFQMWQADGFTPFPVGAHTFEYVIRNLPGDTGTPLVRLKSDVPNSPIPSGGGLLSTSILSAMASVNLTMYPPATTPLAAPGTYFHALWMDYADAQNALNLFWGQFMLDPAVQP